VWFADLALDDLHEKRIAMTTRILVPTDFSRFANVAAEYAVKLARQLNAKVLVAYVKPSVVLPRADGDEADPEEPKLHAMLGRTPADRAGVPVSRHFLRGNPVQEILKLAGEAHIQLIAMGARGQTASSENPLGSIAQSVLSCAKCRVIVVKVESQG